MRLKIVLATTTAVGMLMTASALADNNEATVKQDGDSNSASITQQGNGNYFGTPGVISTYGKVVQTGNHNQLLVLQKGNNNDVAHWAGSTANVTQDGDRNFIDIEQLGSTSGYTGNAIKKIDQDSAGGGSARANSLTIRQGTDLAASRHTINLIQQNNNAAANGAGDVNTVSISQTGPVGYTAGSVVRDVTQNGSGNTLVLTQAAGGNNYVDVVTQNGAGNSATVTENGSQNTVALVSQTVGASTAGGNLATVILTGSKNGTGATGFVTQNGASAWSTGNSLYAREGFVLGSSAAAVGVTQATILQQGGGNSVYYVATGDQNLYGFRQVGDSNIIAGSVTGSNHQLAVLQNGDNNLLDYLQTGSNNVAGVAVLGDQNRLHVKQEQSGGLAGNDVFVSITGNSNGQGVFTKTALVNLANSNGLISGDIFQTGDDHGVSLTVGSNSNNFAFKQFGGNGNTINANIGIGNGNQSVGIQNGSDNTATLNQLGATNTAVFNQIGSNNSTAINQ